MEKGIVVLIILFMIGHGFMAISRQHVTVSFFSRKVKDDFGRVEEKGIPFAITGGAAVLLGAAEIVGAVVILFVSIFSK